jgi:hypothetical protein
VSIGLATISSAYAKTFLILLITSQTYLKFQDWPI